LVRKVVVPLEPWNVHSSLLPQILIEALLCFDVAKKRKVTLSKLLVRGYNTS
jgi:hypothetical protein